MTETVAKLHHPDGLHHENWGLGRCIIRGVFIYQALRESMGNRWFYHLDSNKMATGQADFWQFISLSSKVTAIFWSRKNLGPAPKIQRGSSPARIPIGSPGPIRPWTPEEVVFLCVLHWFLRRKEVPVTMLPGLFFEHVRWTEANK